MHGGNQSPQKTVSAVASSNTLVTAAEILKKVVKASLEMTLAFKLRLGLHPRLNRSSIARMRIKD